MMATDIIIILIFDYLKVEYQQQYPLVKKFFSA